MKTTTVTFKNHPTGDGGFETFGIKGCLVSNNGTPNNTRPQILIHLPKSDSHSVDGAFVNYDGYEWHVIGTTTPQMNDNTPTSWNRYAIAERFRML